MSFLQLYRKNACMYYFDKKMILVTFWAIFINASGHRDDKATKLIKLSEGKSKPLNGDDNAFLSPGGVDELPDALVVVGVLGAEVVGQVKKKLAAKDLVAVHVGDVLEFGLH
jgi:hypothetical protein